MAFTIVLTASGGITSVPSGCAVGLQAYTEVDGQPMDQRRGVVTLYRNGNPVGGANPLAAFGYTHWLLLLPDGTQAMRATFNFGLGDPPVSNTVTFTVGGAGTCVPLTPTPPVLTVDEIRPGAIELSWTPFASPSATRPLRGWNIFRDPADEVAPGGNATNLIDTLDADGPTRYVDNGSGRNYNPLEAGVEYVYNVVPWVNANQESTNVVYVSNSVVARAVGPEGLGLDSVRYRLGG